MLGTSIRGNGCKSESSIRHEVRKLRAKVKGLLPQNQCEHYAKRNERISQIEDKKKSWASTHHFKHWTVAKNHEQQWFNERRIQSQKKGKALFEELSRKQIETINEDKIYYLGEENVKAYDDFLQKQRSHLLNKERHEFEGLKSEKRIDLSQMLARAPACLRKSVYTGQLGISIKDNKEEKSANNRTLQRSSTTSLQIKPKNSLQRFSTNCMPTTSNNLAESERAPNHRSLKTHQKRMEMIEDKLKQKQVYEKLEYNLKMEKGEHNHREMKYRLFSKIKTMKQKQEARYDSALKKRNILLKKGQINKMNEQLRMILIQKRQKQPVSLKDTNKSHTNSYQKLLLNTSATKNI